MVRSASAASIDSQVAERRAGARVEEVERHLVRLELAELGGELGALLEGLAHADEAAAAQLHAGLRTIRQVSQRSSKECVVTTFGK